MLRRLILAFGLFAALLVSAYTPEMEDQVEIYYVGLGGNFEILLPVTPENIVEEHSHYGKVEAVDPRFQEVMALIDGAGAGSFYEGSTGAMLRDSNGTAIYFDRYGGIGKPGWDGALDEASLQRVADLLWSMTAPRQSASGPDWAIEAARAYVAETRGWAETDYRIEERVPDRDGQKGLVILRVLHPDDIAPTFADYNAVMTGNHKSFDLHFDAGTREFVGEER
jgi:hypothetical protein